MQQHLSKVLQKSFNFNVTSDDYFYPHARKFRKTAMHHSKGLAALIVNYRVHNQLALGKKC